MDVHVGEVADPSSSHGGLPAGVVPDDVSGQGVLLRQDRWLDPGDLRPGAHLPRAKVDRGLEGPVRGALVDNDEGLASDGLARDEAEHVLFRWFAERDERESAAGVRPTAGREDLDGCRELLPGERIQRMWPDGHVTGERTSPQDHRPGYDPYTTEAPTASPPPTNVLPPDCD